MQPAVASRVPKPLSGSTFPLPVASSAQSPVCLVAVGGLLGVVLGCAAHRAAPPSSGANAGSQESSGALAGCAHLPDADDAWPVKRQMQRASCADGDAAGCHQLGWWLATGGEEVPNKSEHAAFEFLRCGCEGLGESISCNGLGSLYEYGSGVAQDPVRAHALYTRACDAGLAEACGNMATQYLQGNGVQKDATKAASLYQYTCEREVWSSCAGLGDLFTNGVGVAKDVRRAAELSDVSCQHDVAEGCNNLGVAFLRGSGRPKDPTKAASLFVASCEGHAQGGCYNLGMLRVRGEGVAKDARAAAEVFRSGCHMASPVGRVDCCASLALLSVLGVVRDVSEADKLKWLRQGCDEHVGTSCEVLERLGAESR
jgi:TPR repeat protein